MEFHKYLESVHVKTVMELNKVHDEYGRAKTTAAKDLLDTYRFLLKFINYFQVMGHFILIKLKLVKPLPTAEEMFKEVNKVNAPEVAPVITEEPTKE